jgi:hypothetical protein
VRPGSDPQQLLLNTDAISVPSGRSVDAAGVLRDLPSICSLVSMPMPSVVTAMP